MCRGGVSLGLSLASWELGEPGKPEVESRPVRANKPSYISQERCEAAKRVRSLTSCSCQGERWLLVARKISLCKQKKLFSCCFLKKPLWKIGAGNLFDLGQILTSLPARGWVPQAQRGAASTRGAPGTGQGLLPVHPRAPTCPPAFPGSC